MLKVQKSTPAVAKNHLTVGSIDIGDEKTTSRLVILQKVSKALEEGEIRKAESYLYEGFRQEPDNSRLLGYQTICQALTGKDLEAAENFACRIVAENPNDAFSHFALGRVCLAAGRRRDAFRHFDQARRLGPRDALVKRELSLVDQRSLPVFGSLARDHFLNVFLGRVRSLFQR